MVLKHVESGRGEKRELESIGRGEEQESEGTGRWTEEAGSAQDPPSQAYGTRST